MLLVKDICSTEVPCKVADPDLQIRGGGGAGHRDPEISRGGGVSKKIFLALQASVWSNNKGGPAPLGTSPRSATAIERGVFAIAMIYHVGNYCAKNFRSDLTDLYGCLLPRKGVFTYSSLD